MNLTTPSRHEDVFSTFRLTTFRSLRHRNYRLFFFGQIISLVGTWIQMVAQGWLVYSLTRSSFWLGLIGFLGSLPILGLSLIGGSMADRVSKRALLVATQTLAMSLALCLAFLVWTKHITVAWVGVLAFGMGLANAFDMPARQAFVVEMVGKEDLTNAIALNSAIFNGARLIGPAIGGMLIASVGIAWCFFLNGISFIPVIIGLLAMHVSRPNPDNNRRNSVWQSIREGICYIYQTRPIRALIILVGTVTIFGWSYSILLPVFAKEILHGNAVTLGNLMAANGVGALLSALMLASIGDRIPTRRSLFIGLSTFVVSVTLFSLSKILWLSLLLLVGVGFGLISFFITANSTLQRRVPDQLRGRVMGVYALVFGGFFPIGSLQIGAMAHVLGAPQATIIGAAICAGAAFIVSRTVSR